MRLAEVQEKVAAIDRGHIDPEEAARALAQFDPVWGALLPRERANVMQLLIERIDYDGQGGELRITFRPAGLASLGADTRRAA
jgi:site-specific DNA recombinase